MLPTIPDKIYFTIGEVGRLCLLRAHVLRYWEQEFPQLVPKRRGNRRYYLRDDVLLVRKIKSLLYDQGFTIEGARAKLSSEQNTSADGEPVSNSFIQEVISKLKEIVTELECEAG